MEQHTSENSLQNSKESLLNDSVDEVEGRVICSSKKIFPFVNVEFSDTLLLPYLVGKKTEQVISIIPLSQTLENVGREELLSSNLFRIFAGFPVVVDWKEEQVGDTEIFQTKAEKVSFFVDHHKLYYCGRQVISKEYDSFFLKVVGETETDEYPTISRTLYLVNVNQDSIMSVSVFCSYSWFTELEAYSSTTLDKKGNKHCRIVKWIDDNGNLDCNRDSLVFTFDKVGRIDCSN